MKDCSTVIGWASTENLSQTGIIWLAEFSLQLDWIELYVTGIQRGKLDLKQLDVNNLFVF